MIFNKQLDVMVNSSRISGILAACTLFLISPLASGQTENGIPKIDKPFRDFAVMPADFQSASPEIQFDSKLSGVAEGGKSPITDTVGAPPPESLVRGIKSQLADLDIPRVFGSLAIVLGGYFGLVWFTRRFSGTGSGQLPKDVVEVLGQTPFKPGSHLQLIRLGNKLLLLLNSNEGTQTIGEISDPDEVAALCEQCGVPIPHRRTTNSQSAHSPSTASTMSQSANSDLRQILRQLQRVTDNTTKNSVFEA